MKVIYILLCLLLLPSCVYYGTSREIAIGDKAQTTCAGGSSKENKKCRAQVRKINEAIENRTQP